MLTAFLPKLEPQNLALKSRVCTLSQVPGTHLCDTPLYGASAPKGYKPTQHFTKKEGLCPFNEGPQLVIQKECRFAYCSEVWNTSCARG